MKTYHQGVYSDRLVAVDVERLLRLLDRMPGLEVVTQVTSEDDCRLADEEDGHAADLLTSLDRVEIRIYANRKK